MSCNLYLGAPCPAEDRTHSGAAPRTLCLVSFFLWGTTGRPFAGRGGKPSLLPGILFSVLLFQQEVQHRLLKGLTVGHLEGAAPVPFRPGGQVNGLVPRQGIAEYRLRLGNGDLDGVTFRLLPSK